MLSIYFSLAALGLAAIDPVGIAIMPILLGQKHPYRRALIFLSGSFVSLALMGWLFANGFGKTVLRFEQHNSWFVPSAELIAATVLLIIAVVAYVQIKRHKASLEPSKRVQNWLVYGDAQLFLVGAGLVMVQSVLDIVFVVAMVKLGQSQLSELEVIAAVSVYAFTALALQLAVVAAFMVVPQQRKARLLEWVHRALAGYAEQAVIVVSLTLSCGLFLLALWH